MPDEVGGQPFPDGEEPEYRDHGAADDVFASVVLDESFVRAAQVHEPSAAERVRAAAAQSHAERAEHAENPEHTETDAPRVAEDGLVHGRGMAEFPDSPYGEPPEEGVWDEDPDGDDDRFGRPGRYGEYGPGGLPPELEAYEHGADFGYARGAHGPYAARGSAPRPYRGHRSWQRPIAWVLAVVMGIGMVALAFSALYRGTSDQRDEPVPPPASTGVEPTDPGALPTVTAQPPGG
ncbi:hypothetical protein MMF93_11050 [Streptomyces tubbatahanensis]|uniref:Uncharacterized protein n=1 Tax=Streptomyces tubbatahanensis TaxID=2923272 RepID=A0ABY3XRY9_9ACTN|nr:hypothetical protein [Streptomyces tubbatahanensis]UNS96983.1 hypothetical protein MMF93_11050 [Streptomyces tubbatahanensis]